MDTKIRDEALSDDPTQIKGRFGTVESFVGDPNDLSRYVIGGSDLSNILKHYVHAMYVDISDVPGTISIPNYRGNIEDIPVEVPMLVLLNNDFVDPVGEVRNTIVFLPTSEGQDEVTYEIRKRDVSTGAYVPVDSGDCKKFNVYTMFLSAQGFMVVSVFQEVNNFESINNRLGALESTLTGVVNGAGLVDFGTNNIKGAVVTGTQFVQVGTESCTFSTVSVNNLTASGTVNLSGAIVSVGTPTAPGHAVNKEHLDSVMAGRFGAFNNINDKFLVGTASQPSGDPRCATAPIGTFYFRVSS